MLGLRWRLVLAVPIVLSIWWVAFFVYRSVLTVEVDGYRYTRSRLAGIRSGRYSCPLCNNTGYLPLSFQDVIISSGGEERENPHEFVITVTNMAEADAMVRVAITVGSGITGNLSAGPWIQRDIVRQEIVWAGEDSSVVFQTLLFDYPCVQHCWICNLKVFPTGMLSRRPCVCPVCLNPKHKESEWLSKEETLVNPYYDGCSPIE